MADPTDQRSGEAGRFATDTPWRRDPAELAERLGRWARDTWGAGAQVAGVTSPENGMSSETVLFDVAHDDGTDRLVARLAPLPDVFPVFPTYDLEAQARVMRLVGERTEVPVPEVRHVVPDPGYLGVPFLVMARSGGRAPADIPPYVFGGWLADLGPTDRRQLQDAAVEVLARIHEVTPADADLAFLERPDHGTDALDQHLGHERTYYEWACGRGRCPTIERAFAWLDDHRPRLGGPIVLNWGDARIGNVLWDGTTPTAVLDWEMAAVGPAEVDLSWMIVQHRLFQHVAETFEVPGLPDLMRRDDVATTYERLTGRSPEALGWFEVFAAVRLATVSARTKLRDIAYGRVEAPQDGDDLFFCRPLLAEMVSGPPR